MGEKSIVTLLADHKFSMCSPQSCQRTLLVTQSLALPVVSTSCELPDMEKSESVGAEGYNCKTIGAQRRCNIHYHSYGVHPCSVMEP